MRHTMAIIFLLALAGGIYFYNTIWFQATFKDDFINEISYEPFDVTKKGAVLSLPIKYRYNTCYKLAIAVPDKNVFHHHIVGPGILKYRFVSNGRVIAEGRTFEAQKQNLMYSLGITSINILVFNLPFPGAGGDLTLELEVLEPMTFLEPYAGNTYCKINPDYDPKFCKCYNEDLMIPQQAAGN
ncbi:hypothetical protein [Desulfovibrio sp.]